MILFNPVLIGVLLMCALCLARFNVLLAILVSALLTGVLGGIELSESLKILIGGMAGNLETALSYVLLGALAAAVSQSNLTAVLVEKISHTLAKGRKLLIFSIAFLACFSQNLIPIHIAFIPILIPPLLTVMNQLKIDRRAVACALTFGLKAPYVSFSVGFGLIFHGILVKEISANGMEIALSDVSQVMWIGGAAMLLGLILAVFYYRKPREYLTLQHFERQTRGAKLHRKEWVILAGIFLTFIVQLKFSSLPLGALFGLLLMIFLGGIPWQEMDRTIEQGLHMMAFIAFVMLVAAGFAAVIRATGGINELVNAVSSIAGGKIGGALIMLLIGLLITMGIGTSFGTIPILATIYVPLCLSLGFGISATILLIGIAAALGDAGSPASDSTLGPTSGLNADNQHNHIFDTCVPTFVFFNIPLFVAAILFSLFL